MQNNVIATEGKKTPIGYNQLMKMQITTKAKLEEEMKKGGSLEKFEPSKFVVQLFDVRATKKVA